tara:strand:+ start:2584 stop:3132 length:549 start_codon:yes stop_codon:yes gene_type:complete
MKKHIFHLLFLALIFNSCIINDFVLDDVSFNFNLTNYTNKSWDEGTLYVGAKNKQGDFIATDSIKYIPVVSNISPINTYTDNSYGSNGKYQEYHYYKVNNLQFVTIPYPIFNFGSLKADKSKLTSISSTFGFVFKLSDGKQVYVKAYDIKKGIEDNRVSINFDIKNKGIVGYIRDNNYNDGY